LSKPSAHSVKELAELRQRVRAAEARLGKAAEEDRMRNERLSSLLGVVEEGFACSQHRIESLSEELARANQEMQQLQAMLQALLAAAEDDGAHGIGAARRELEARINRLSEAALSISGTRGESATEMTKGCPATVSSDEEDSIAAGSETGTEPAIRPSEKVLQKALAAAEKAKGVLGGEAKEEARSDPTMAEPAGTPRNGQEQASTSPVPEASPEADKKVGHQSLLDIPDFLDRRSEATFAPVRQRAGVRHRS
jgi:hypothetical protein